MRNEIAGVIISIALVTAMMLMAADTMEGLVFARNITIERTAGGER